MIEFSSFSDRRAVKQGSRGLQPTVADWKNIVSHRDTGTRRSPKQISLIHWQIMQCDKLPVFLLKRQFGMMLALASDIANRVCHLRLADRKRAIAILPCEHFHRRPLIGNPLGRLAFEASHPFAQRDRGWQTYQQVNVIFHTADLQCGHSVRPTDAADVSPDVFLNGWRDPGLAIFSRKNHMQTDGGVGVSHIPVNAIRCRSATQSSALAPHRGLKPTATLRDRAVVDEFLTPPLHRGLKPTATLRDRAAVDEFLAPPFHRGLKPTATLCDRVAVDEFLAPPFHRGLKSTATLRDRAAVDPNLNRRAVEAGSRGLQPTVGRWVGGWRKYRVASRHRNPAGGLRP